jgi:hypothetical protein
LEKHARTFHRNDFAFSKLRAENLSIKLSLTLTCDAKMFMLKVEGEIDKLSLYEAGFPNCVSVPDGAPPKASDDVIDPTQVFSRTLHFALCVIFYSSNAKHDFDERRD